MPFNSPISSEKVDRILRLLELPVGGRALDVGCGNGEFLLRAVARHGIAGVGIDRDAACIATAREKALERGLTSRCDFHAADANDFPAGDGPYDLGICIGSTHAFGTGEAAYPNTIGQLSKAVRPGGYILVGEGYWKQQPASEYLQLIGDPVGIYRDHAGNISFAEERGLLPLYATVGNDDEWDHFEWSHQLKVRRLAEANPDDPTSADRLTRARQWREGYLRWGRSTMGFGMYLFRAPGEAT
jgi:SAM-dependent methyltransferase